MDKDIHAHGQQEISVSDFLQHGCTTACSEKARAVSHNTAVTESWLKQFSRICMPIWQVGWAFTNLDAT